MPLPSAGEISKLFGFIAKETPKSTHLFNAAMGAGAKGVYNVATGRDLTDGMLGWGLMGAAGSIGWKTYKGRGMASSLAKAEGGFGKALEALGSKVSAAKSATTAEAKAAAITGVNASATEARGFNQSLNDVRQKVGLRTRGGVRANQAAQQGGVVASAVATADRHATVAASNPSAGPIRQSMKQLRQYDMSAGSGIMGGRQRGAMRPFQYQRSASAEAQTLKRQAAQSRQGWTNMTQRAGGAWVG